MSKATATIPVKGMTCSSCENSVNTALGKLPGVGSVAADATNDQVEVQFDPHEVTVERMMQVIQVAGFDVN